MGKDYKKEFEISLKKRRVSRVTYFLGCLFMVLALLNIIDQNKILSIIFIGIMAILLGIAFYLNNKYWRCPKCKARYGFRYSKFEDRVTNCPYCGEKIRDIYPDINKF